MGFTHFSQLHPGSKYALPILVSPTFASSTLPLSKDRVSSGDFILFFCIFAVVVIYIESNTCLIYQYFYYLLTWRTLQGVTSLFCRPEQPYRYTTTLRGQ